MNVQDMVEEVKKRVLVPDYFNKIILNERALYYSDYTVDFEAKPVVKCPLHDENTPSFRYYEDTNTYNCFGCGSAGDIIQLHREYILKSRDINLTFESCVKGLYDYFIVGNIDSGVNKSNNDVKELNTKSEILYYSNFIGNLEKKLISSDSISIEAKEFIYGWIDEMTLLINKNMVKANDAVVFLEHTIRRY